MENAHVVTFDVTPKDDPAIICAQIAATLDSLIGNPNGATVVIHIQPVA